MLGPTLFVIFKNPIDQVLEKLPGFLSKFADDTKVGGIADNQEECAVLQQILDYLVEWADKWQMRFNADKCKVIHFGRNNIRHKYVMGGYAPPASSSRK